MSWFSDKWKSIKKVAKQVGRALKKGSGYYAIRKWADNGPYWKKLLAGTHPAAGNYYLRDKASEWGHQVGEWVGEHMSVKTLIIGTILLPRISPVFWTILQGWDMYTGGSVSEGYISTLYDDEIPLKCFDATWDHYPALELFNWYPGSAEWDEFATGGAFYNPTQPLEPWQKMLNMPDETDSFGMMVLNMFDLDNPADIGAKYAGSGFYKN